MSKPCVIAFYLPQFHPIPENDLWWGKGFTEWTNVGKARPLFRGHCQPRVPADLGYYDLRIPEVRQAQADMAKLAGVDAFCYWHYWFGDGRRLLEMPFNEVLVTGSPDFPFCLAWANHSWYAKTWDNKGSDKLLIEQKYNGVEDYRKHFEAVLPAFNDPRYLRIDNKPVFAIFKPLHHPEMALFIKEWNMLAKKNGLDGIYFVGQSTESQMNEILSLGFDAVNHEEVNRIHAKQSIVKRAIMQFQIRVLKHPRKYDYLQAMRSMISGVDKLDNVFPTICPNYDHTPRSGTKGIVYTNANPSRFRDHVNQILSLIKDKPCNRQVVFLKSWNEWGEGNYMEPDLQYGNEYILTLADCLKNYNR